jgi:putative transposase
MVQPYVAQPSDFVPFQPYMVVPRILPESKDTKAINKRYGRVGSLFQGRFQAVRVDRDEYLVHLSRYIHLNPVIAKLVEQPEDWEFSSYREYVGLRAGTLPKTDVVLSQFPSRDVYRQFVGSCAEGDGKTVEHLTLE